MELDLIHKITNMEELQAEKLRLQVLSAKQKEILKSDFEYLKTEFAPLALLNRAATTVVPEPVRRSTLINDPINFIARKLFHKEDNVVSTHSDQGKGNVMRNIALSLVEAVGSYLISKYIRRRIF